MHRAREPGAGAGEHGAASRAPAHTSRPSPSPAPAPAPAPPCMCACMRPHDSVLLAPDSFKAGTPPPHPIAPDRAGARAAMRALSPHLHDSVRTRIASICIHPNKPDPLARHRCEAVQNSIFFYTRLVCKNRSCNISRSPSILYDFHVPVFCFEPFTHALFKVFVFTGASGAGSLVSREHARIQLSTFRLTMHVSRNDTLM